MKAVWNGNLQDAKRFLDNDANINAHINERGMRDIGISGLDDMPVGTPLMLACERMNHAMVDLLLSYKPDLNVAVNGETALSRAIHQDDDIKDGHYKQMLRDRNLEDYYDDDEFEQIKHTYTSAKQPNQIVQKLLMAGANPDAENGIALHLAINYRNLEVIKLLYNDGMGADLNIQRPLDDPSNYRAPIDYGTPLMRAIRLAPDIAEQLLLMGADVEAKSQEYGRTALMQAARSNSLDMIYTLVMHHGADLEAKDEKGYTALGLALIKGDNDYISQIPTEAVKTLLELGAKLENAFPNTGRPLSYQVQQVVDIYHPAWKILQEELKTPGIHQERREKFGTPPKTSTDKKLVKAFFQNNPEGISEALSEGANPNITNPWGQTLIAMASKFDWREVAKILVKDKRTNINTPDTFGLTPLMHAVKYRNVEMVDLLMRHHADFRATSNEGKTAREYMESCLDRDGEDPSAPWDIAIEKIIAGGTPKVIADGPVVAHLTGGLLNEHVNFSDDHNGQLYKAIYQNNEEWAIKLASSDEANPNSKDNRDTTLLMLATSKGMRDLVDVLLLHQANPNLQEAVSGETALGMAAAFGHTNIAGLLLYRGAKVNHHDNYGFSPLSKAIDLGNEAMVELLLKYGADPNLSVAGAGNAIKHAKRAIQVAENEPDYAGMFKLGIPARDPEAARRIYQRLKDWKPSDATSKDAVNPLYNL